jgi:butyryl-CoA dehydrogenase
MIPAPVADHLTGHLAADHPLAARRAFAGAATILRPFVDYEPASLWELDTRSLPRSLAKYRRRARAFAKRRLQPPALTVDGLPHRGAGEPLPEALAKLVATAGAEGWLTDMLPRPWGSMPPTSLRHPFAMRQALKVEEFSAACGGLMLLLCAHVLGVAPIMLSGDPGAIRRFLLPAFREIRRGRPHLFAYAITEPGAGSDAEDGHGASVYRPGVVARRTRGGWLLSGRKCFISGGDLARSICVFAALEGEDMASWTCFLVRNDMSGFRPARNELKMGMRASPATELELDGVFMPDDHVIGGLRGGWALNRATLNYSRLPVAAMGVGLARRAAEATLAAAVELKTGGESLLDTQQAQLTLAQMMAEVRAARALVWQAARRFAPRQAEASIGKFFCTDTAVRVCERAMDLLGPEALLQHRGIEKCFRDARLTQIFEGTNQINRLAVIEDLQDLILAGRLPSF